jgi:competence protein ComEC
VLNSETTSPADADVDNSGVVLRVSNSRISFLLTADIMRKAEVELVSNRAQVKSTVLKVAHHGSGASSCREFLAVASPTSPLSGWVPTTNMATPTLR